MPTASSSPMPRASACWSWPNEATSNFPRLTHWGMCFRAIVQRRTYPSGARPAAGRCRRRAAQTLQGGGRRRQLGGRHRDPEAVARVGLRGRGTQLRAYGRVRPQSGTSARESDGDRRGGRPREGRSGRGGRSRRRPAGLRERGRLDVCRGVYAGGRGRLRVVAPQGRYGLEPQFVAGAARCDRASWRPLSRFGRGRSQRRGEDEGGRRRHRRRRQRRRDLSRTALRPRRAGGRGAVPDLSGADRAEDDRIACHLPRLLRIEEQDRPDAGHRCG